MKDREKESDQKKSMSRTLKTASGQPDFFDPEIGKKRVLEKIRFLEKRNKKRV